MKKKYGLLGRNISYSFSEKYFNERFENENINSQYFTFDLQSIKEISEILKDNSINGLNVTIPYKQDVFPYLDDLSETAEAIGAVNVIKFEKDGRLTGHNSDYYGFKASLLPLISTKKPEKALILGTGGASKAVAYALEELGIEYAYVSRTEKQNQFTYTQLNAKIIANHLLIINCSPVGTFPNITDCPDIPYEYLSSDHILYDLIYNPEETQFMKHGSLKGCKTSNGYKMLILQAEKAWEIWNS